MSALALALALRLVCVCVFFVVGGFTLAYCICSQTKMIRKKFVPGCWYHASRGKERALCTTKAFLSVCLSVSVDIFVCLNPSYSKYLS